MKFFSATILSAVLFFPAALRGEDITKTFEQVEMVPLGTLQLGEAGFIAPTLFRDLNIPQGQPVVLEGPSGDTVEVLLYPIDRDESSISLKRDLREALGVTPGEAAIKMRILNSEEATLEPIDLTIQIEGDEGEPDQWPGVLLGAPHGDSDLYTGDIVQLVTEQSGIPSIAAYRVRMSYLGQWIDGNRPLQREPRELFGIKPDRSWTQKAESIYHQYRDTGLEVSRPSASAEPYDPPLDLYVDFHGHDLTCLDQNGKRVGRYIVECMARGYTMEEVRWLKSEFDQALKDQYGEEAPPSVWGNLPEDRWYECEGQEVEFFYTGFGGRVYGMLGPDNTKRSIHIESPNFLRIDEEHRVSTATALAKFIGEVNQRYHQENTTTQHQWVRCPGGEFVIGADDGEGWSNMRPQRSVNLEPFEISKYEVTNAQYVHFVNERIKEGAAEIRDFKVYDATTGELWLALAPTVAMTPLRQRGEIVSVDSGYENHPVVQVTWFGAQAFAQSMDAQLPTEAQWEYAAGWSAEENKAVRWKEKDDRSYQNLFPGNYTDSPSIIASTFSGTTDVGAIANATSPLGAHDMIGNVWEWTQDWYANYPAEESLVVEPQGPETGTMKSIRGGSWDTEPSTATSTFRTGVAPHQPLATLGFRILRKQ